MTEKPILFSGPMVRAILDGRKTQTRRALKPQPEYRENESVSGHYGTFFHGWNLDHDAVGILDIEQYCPYGKPGDTLYIREPYRTEARYDHLKPSELPDSAIISYEADYDNSPNDGCRGRYRHGRFMPKRFSRLFLKIKDVRVERLQDISDRDIAFEGIDHTAYQGHPPGYSQWMMHQFANLWDSINGNGAWEQNPWVWAVSFEKV